MKIEKMEKVYVTVDEISQGVREAHDPTCGKADDETAGPA